MRDRKPSRRRANPVAVSTSEQRLPELPAWKAFVVQFTRDTEPDAKIFGGRIEHLSSGRRARFESADDLIAALQRLLSEVGCGSPESPS